MTLAPVLRSALEAVAYLRTRVALPSVTFWVPCRPWMVRVEPSIDAIVPAAPPGPAKPKPPPPAPRKPVWPLRSPTAATRRPALGRAAAAGVAAAAAPHGSLPARAWLTAAA